MRLIDPSHPVTLFGSCGVLVLAMAACSSDKQPARQPSAISQPAIAAQQAAPAPAAARDDRETTVQLSQDFRARCSLPEAPQEAPRFEYDQATLRPRGENVLDAVAQCLKDGPLKDQTITIVGRADPRGTEQYNEDLAASRAAAARNYLVQRGVSAERIKLVSRGEQGARGSDEATWALDRRVDLELGDLSTAATGGTSAGSAGKPAGTGAQGTGSPILQGTRMQIESAESSERSDAASYADTAEGAKPGQAQVKGTGDGSGSASSKGSSSGSTKGSTSGSSASGSAKGSADVSVGNR